MLEKEGRYDAWKSKQWILNIGSNISTISFKGQNSLLC